MFSNEPKQAPSLYRSLQDEVVATAATLGVTVSLDTPFLTELIEIVDDETKFEEKFKETPQLRFEEVIVALKTVETASSKLNSSGVEHYLLTSTVLTVREAINSLRHQHHLEPLTGLEKVEEALRQRAQELNAEMPPTLYQPMEDAVVATAESLGITVRRYEPFTRRLFDYENPEETPQMLFEDVIKALQVTTNCVSSERESSYVENAALTTRNSIDTLRNVHHVEPLTGLEKVEEALNQRAKELEAGTQS